jgi:DNA-binding NtrC family response regulator
MAGMTGGAFDYLLKPVSIDELVYKIEDARRHKQLNEDAIRSGDDPIGRGRG